MSYAGGSGKSGGGRSFGAALGLLAAITGLLAFFGYPTYKDLVNGGISASATPVASPLDESEPDPEPSDRETVRWEYVAAADKVCLRFTSKAGKIPDVDHVTVDWMKKHLTLRRQMIEAWRKVEWPGELSADAVNAAQIRKIWSDFDDATAAWSAMTEDLRRTERTRFNQHLEFYTTARDSFVDGANGYGFSVCNYGWSTVSPWR